MDPSILILCTGNATRSVIAGAVLKAHLPDVEIATAGTMSIDGLPMSWRTKAGFEAVGVKPPSHRSRQVLPPDLDAATLIIGLAPEHVSWVRREHPSAAPRTATLKRLVRDLAGRRPAARRARRRARARRHRAAAVGGGRRPGRRRGRGVHRLRPGGRAPGRRAGGALTLAADVRDRDLDRRAGHPLDRHDRCRRGPAGAGVRRAVRGRRPAPGRAGPRRRVRHRPVDPPGRRPRRAGRQRRRRRRVDRDDRRRVGTAGHRRTRRRSSGSSATCRRGRPAAPRSTSCCRASA